MAEASTNPLDQGPDPALAAGQPLLAFVHIPRTGGRTVWSAIAKNYAPLRDVGNFQRGPEKTRTALERLGAASGAWKALGGHAPLGLFLRHLPSEARYMTILREPVDRVLSHYHFHARLGERKLKSTWEDFLGRDAAERGAEPVTLEDETDFSLEAGLARSVPIYDNFMTGSSGAARRSSGSCLRTRSTERRRTSRRSGSSASGSASTTRSSSSAASSASA